MHFSLCDFVLDIVQNSVEAESDQVTLILDESRERFILNIQDNGCGMDEETKARALDPFFTDGVKHKARRVGLGLPFLKQALDDTGGSFSLESIPGEGTVINCRFDMTHWDTPPVGDVASLIMQCMMLPGSFELTVRRSLENERGRDEYELNRSELREILGDFDQGDAVIMLRQFIRSQEDDLIQGDNHG